MCKQQSHNNQYHKGPLPIVFVSSTHCGGLSLKRVSHPTIPRKSSHLLQDLVVLHSS